MHRIPVTTADLLEAWRDAVRAAELAERLATSAARAAQEADVRAVASDEIADLAEQAAHSAARAADRARAAAQQAAELARLLREEGMVRAQATVGSAHALEEHARVSYREAEAEAAAQLEKGLPAD